ncbi:MAG: cbb3-type cytochrome oxidase assembly protein CcoS [Kofleriaceae bacterium]
MLTMYVVLALALGGAGLAVAAFAWSVRSGQLDDLDTPAQRMLTDELTPRGTDDAATRR